MRRGRERKKGKKEERGKDSGGQGERGQIIMETGINRHDFTIQKSV